MNKLRFILLFAVVLLAQNRAAAYDFESDGIYYNIIDADAKQVEVTCQDNQGWSTQSSYTESVYVPSTVISGTTTYSVTKIGSYAFANSSVTSVRIAEGIEIIDNNSFINCSQLLTLSLPTTLRSIGYNAFWYCTKLEELTLPEGLLTVRGDAFYGCSSVTKLVLPSTLTSIENDAFNNMSSLVLVISNIGVPFEIQKNAFASRDWNDWDRMDVYSPSSATLVVPVGTTALYQAIEGWTMFDEISESEPVVEQGDDGLWYSYNNGESTAKIIHIDYRDMGKLTIASKVMIKGQEYSVKSIGSNAFESAGIDTLVIEEGIEKISSYAFRYNYNMRAVTLPSTLKSIGNQSFYNCGIRDLNIPEGVTTIEYAAFRYCGSLNKVVIPSTITSIDGCAFMNASGLNSVVSKIAVPDSISQSVFAISAEWNGDEQKYYFTTTSAKLYVPTGTTDKYQAAFGWNSFADIVEGEPKDTIVDHIRYSYVEGGTTAKVVGGDDSGFTKATILGSLQVGDKNYSVTEVGARAFQSNGNLDTLIIKSGIEIIGEGAFYDNYSLRSVKLPTSLKTIAKEAFHNCRIDSLIIPEGVDSIAEGAFRYQYGNMRALSLPKSLRTIGREAFYYCYGFKSMAIPEGVTDIGERAFYYCNGLIDLKLPSTLTSIGNYAFYRCNNLNAVTSRIDTPFEISKTVFSTQENEVGVDSLGKSIYDYTPSNATLYVPEGKKASYEAIPGWNMFANIIEGELLEATVDSLTYSYLKGKGNATLIGHKYSQTRKVIIPGTVPFDGETYTVKEIGASVFQNYNKLDTLIIKEGVETIGSYAFSDNYSLKSLSLPSSLKTIGNYAFNNCRMDTLVVPEGVDSIGASAFRYNYNLKSLSLPASLRVIGDNAFYYNSRLDSLALPEGLTTIGYDAFGYIGDNYGGVKIVLPSTLASIGDYAFRTNNSIVLVTSHIQSPFEISQNVFGRENGSEWDEEKQEYVTIYTPSTAKLCVPDGTKASYEAIKGWTMFSGIYEGDMKETTVGLLNYSYFEGKGVAIVVAGNNYREIRNLTIPGSITVNGSNYTVKEIDANVFKNCYIDTLVIEDGIETIGKNAFRENYDYLKSITLPSTLKTIGDYAFYNDYNFRNIEIPAGVSVIGEGAFQYCNGLNSVSIPDGVEKINGYTFYNCNNLTSVSLPESIKTIGDNAFAYCNKLDTISIPGKVESIGDNAFNNCKIKEINIPATTKTIGNDAFNYCNAVTSIKVAAGNTVYDSRNNCNALIETASNKLIKGCAASVIPNTVTEIGDRAFYAVTALTGISIPNSVQRIDYSAFADCDGLTAINIPSSVTYIASEAFAWCDNLSSINIDADNSMYDSRDNCNAIIETSSNRLVLACNNTVIPRGIKKIGDSAFRGCNGIDSLKIPYGVEELEWGALSYTSLKYVEIPNSVKKLRDRLIEGSGDNLVVVSKIKDPSSISVDGNPFYSSSYWTDNGYVRFMDSAILYVPRGKKESYEATYPWNNFSSILEMEGDTLSRPTLSFDGRYVTAISADKDVDMYYSTDGGTPTTYYDGPIPVSDLCTVKVFAEKSFAIDSEEATCEVKYLYDGETLKQSEAGHLSDAVKWFGTDKVEKLKVDGKMSSDEFAAIRTMPNLKFLNLAKADIESLEIPDSAFAGSNIVSFVAPAKISTTLGKGIFANCQQLAAVNWATSDNLPNLTAEAFDNVNNPNMLFYMKTGGTAPDNIRNIIEGGKAKVITLSDATGNNNFYCPVAFQADSISYTRNFQQKTEVGESRGWETLTLPFNVSKIEHGVNGELVPFSRYYGYSYNHPFWLFTLQNDNVTAATNIIANVPYLICMPNNDIYGDDFNQAGNVTFYAKNVSIVESIPVEETQGDITFVPAYQSVPASADVFALNVNQEYKGYPAGSLFVNNFREVRPFEAYSVHPSAAENVAASRVMTVASLIGGGEDTTGIIDVMLKKNDGANGNAVVRVYSLSGALVKQGKAEDVTKGLPKGIYIANGKKFVVR